MSPPPIVILKTGEPPPGVRALHGDFEDWIAVGLGCEAGDLRVVNVYQGEVLTALSEIRGVVITGSPAMVTERPDWSEASARWVAELVRKDVVPILGLCYGHQLLAHALGGEVGTNPNGREMGTVDVTFSVPSAESSDALAPLFEAGVFAGHMSHVESVLRPPSGARVLARTPLDPHSVIEFGPRQWGVQFHPEFDRSIMQRYVDVRRLVLAEEGIDADQLIASATDTPALTRVLERFAAVVASAAASWVGS